MRSLCRATILLALTISPVGTALPADVGQTSHNLILFVADGLRAGVVDAALTPNMAGLLQRGVRFANPHSVFPTFTTANASAMATGHLLGDTGDFSNVEYVGFPVPSAGDSPTPFLENDAVLTDVNARFAGNYLNETTILSAARAAGYSTATIGKLGPAYIFDSGTGSDATLVVDDTTGKPGGVALPDELRVALGSAGLPLVSPTRGENGKPGNATTPGTTTANVGQQAFFADVATKAVLPLFRQRARPFVMVYWSRDPDGSQHNQGDSLGQVTPGINGPTSMASIRNADANLGQLLAALKEQGLAETTDVILTADHGFSTISKESATSFAASQSYDGVPAKSLPPGFVAIDLAHGLGLPLLDPDAHGAAVAAGHFPSKGNGLIGGTAAAPQVVVAANGGSDLVYIPSADRAVAAEVVRVLAAQDYVSGLFVDSRLGDIPGTLPLSAIGLEGSAATPRPAIVVNFRSYALGCPDPTTCAVEIADTGLQQGQGMHGTLSRADTRNIMGAEGPDFARAMVDEAPASNADLGRTILAILALKPADNGHAVGRVLSEAMPGGAPSEHRAEVLRSSPDEAGHVTILRRQVSGTSIYLDAGGYAGRTVGLE